MPATAPSPQRAHLEDLLSRRILLLDGAMGSMIMAHKFEREEDFRGERFAGHHLPLLRCYDVLTLTRPKIIEDIHRAYLEAGSDIIETNTFICNAVQLSNYGLEGHAHELNRAGAALARKVADEFTAKTPHKPRFVAGSIGPTDKSTSVATKVEDPGFRGVTFDELVAAYTTQIEGLVDGGADILFAETTFDTLNLKACLFAIDAYVQRGGPKLPVMISGTIVDKSGRTMSGQTIEAYWESISHFDMLSVGINCALGAVDMRPYLESLSGMAPTFTSCHPNAGLPDGFDGFDDTSEHMAKVLREYASRGWLNIVGGCCGSTPETIRLIAEAVEGLAPRVRPGARTFRRTAAWKR